MINDIFIDQLQFVYRSLSLNTENITQDEAMAFPEPAGNCMNWVLGHMLEYRNRILVMLGEKPLWNEGEIKCYLRGSSAKEESGNFLQWQQLLNYLNHSQELLVKLLKQEEITNEEHIKSMARFCFHESYHSGQVGLLRRLLGKEGQIK